MSDKGAHTGKRCVALIVSRRVKRRSWEFSRQMSCVRATVTHARLTGLRLGIVCEFIRVRRYVRKYVVSYCLGCIFIDAITDVLSRLLYPDNAGNVNRYPLE